MNIKTEKLSTDILLGKPEGYINRTLVMGNEIEGVHIEYISVKGPQLVSEAPGPDHYHVLLSLSGKAKLDLRGGENQVNNNFIIKIPYDTEYNIRVEVDHKFNYLIIRKSLDVKDRQVMLQDRKSHDRLYLKLISDCQTYTEDIKSDQTVNRIILPEGMVPRLCMGSVQTTGPDEVKEHNHPMLDQLFFGLTDCNCTCYAGNEKAVLTENTLLHIPLGSKHSVTVAEGQKLSYVWFDFFITLEGQKYLNEHHHMV
jgi:mannose-6-phosphate isomerase-like protein (cupin superfamily)